MDYFIGFLLGYFLKEMISYLNKLSKWDNEVRASWDKEWDFISYNEDDLP